MYNLPHIDGIFRPSCLHPAFLFLIFSAYSFLIPPRRSRHPSNLLFLPSHHATSHHIKDAIAFKCGSGKKSASNVKAQELSFSLSHIAKFTDDDFIPLTAEIGSKLSRKTQERLRQALKPARAARRKILELLSHSIEKASPSELTAEEDNLIGQTPFHILRPILEMKKKSSCPLRRYPSPQR
jgi:hypothetical protein